MVKRVTPKDFIFCSRTPHSPLPRATGFRACGEREDETELDSGGVDGDRGACESKSSGVLCVSLDTGSRVGAKSDASRAGVTCRSRGVPLPAEDCVDTGTDVGDEDEGGSDDGPARGDPGLADRDCTGEDGRRSDASCSGDSFCATDKGISLERPRIALVPALVESDPFEGVPVLAEGSRSTEAISRTLSKRRELINCVFAQCVPGR